ncbi:MAG TPA: PASTA domain-containing protein [Gaiellaceae bacterium]|nr:PASTA domain-containing protein [Gaiellaceae bacterium]
MLAAALALVPSAAAASRGQAPGSVTHTTGGAPVTVTVSVVGDGMVVSSPPGISCGSTCSAQFPNGTEIFLGPLPVVGWGFGDWSVTPPYLCQALNPHDPSGCELTLDDSFGTTVSLQATFTRLPSPPPHCTVPGLKGKTLARAKVFLRASHCGVGKVRYSFSRNVEKGRVISQNPLAGWHREQGAKVNLVVGKGRRKNHTAGRNRHGTT